MKKYLTVYEKFRKEITLQKYAYGAKLPSKRAIAENLGVSVVTVEHALELLCSEGYVSSKERSGYFAVYRNDLYGRPDSARKAGAGGFTDSDDGNPAGARSEKVITGANIPGIRLSGAEDNGYFPFTVFASAVRKILNDKGEKLSEKSPNRGVEELREAIAAYLLRNRGIEVSADRIVIGAGSEYLYGTIADLLCGKLFAVENPCYDKIEKVYASRGVEFVRLPLSPCGIPSDVLAKSKANVLHVTPFQSYPTGISVDASKKKEYLDFAVKRDGFLIEDDYASEFSIFSKLSDTIFSTDTTGSVIYLNSFSQTIFPSIRAAYAVLPEGLNYLYNGKAGFYSCPVPVLEQYFIAEILNNGSFERHINKIRRAKRNALKNQT